MKRIIHTKFIFLLFMFAVLSFGLVACAVPMEPEVNESASLGTKKQSIINGFPSSSTRFDAIGAITYNHPVLGWTLHCSATLVGKTRKTLLTAKHCVGFMKLLKQLFKYEF